MLNYNYIENLCLNDSNSRCFNAKMSSYVWNITTKLNRTINMRVLRSGDDLQAVNLMRFLLDVGEDDIAMERIVTSNSILIPDSILIQNKLPNTLESLILLIFPNIHSGIVDDGTINVELMKC